jgi:hypothetical protein
MKPACERAPAPRSVGTGRNTGIFLPSLINRHDGCWKAEPSFWRHFICPDAEPRQGSRAKGMGQRHVRGVAALRNEDTTDSGGVVAWIKGIPTVAEINFNPCGKIHRRVRPREADVSDVTSAIARRDVQATAEGNCKMRVVATNAAVFLVHFERRSGGRRLCDCAQSRRWPAPAASQAAYFRRAAKPRRIDDRSHSNDCQAKTV